MGVMFILFLGAFAYVMLGALYRRRRYGAWGIGGFEAVVLLLVADLGMLALGSHCFALAPAPSYCLGDNAIGRLYDRHILLLFGVLILLMFGIALYSFFERSRELYLHLKRMFGR